MKVFFTLALSLLMCSCATPYQKNGFMGGFDDTALSPNIFKVSFRGNGYTSMERAKDYALLRCAEVSLEHGYKYFIVTTDESYTKSNHVYVPGQTHASYSGTTTAQVHPGGNVTATTHGSVNSYTTPSFAFDVDNPHAVLIVIGFNDQETIPGAFDAEFLKNSIRTKYKIDGVKK
uniref:Lipoprotein n=1 Tax=Desulfovibrio sp. U5L TaxID=596152 RepID=I2PZY7_9BACT